MAATKKRTEVEWQGGIGELPAEVADESGPYRPEVLFWVDSAGAILGSTVAKPGDLLAMAAASLQAAIERPMCGPPHTPTKLTVASPDLARVLRTAYPAIQVGLGETPQVDDVFEQMGRRMAHDALERLSYLSPDVSEMALASFFRAAAGLYRAAPWEVVPSEQVLFQVSIEGLGLREAVLSIIGQHGGSTGLLVFRNVEDFDAFLDAADALDYGEEPEMPPHFGLNFEAAAAIGAKRREEIALHGWEVAGDDAHPWVMHVDAHGARAAPAAEVGIAEAIALALPEFLSDRAAVSEAIFSGRAMERSIPVRTHGGPLEVAIRVPVAAAHTHASHELSALFDLADEGDEGDEIAYDSRRESALSNPTKFGMAKSGPAGHSPPAPRPRTTSPAAAQAKKNQRKAARKARKKGR